MIATIIQHYVIHPWVINITPWFITIVLAVIGFIAFIVAVEEAMWEPFVFALCFWAFIAIPATTMAYGYHSIDHLVRMQVEDPTTHVLIWVPAHRQSDGTWWPNNGKRVH